MRILNGKNQPRLAYLATKSDVVKDKDNLEKLLKHFNANVAGFEEAYFTCSACVASETGDSLPFVKWPANGWGEAGVYFSPVPPPKYTGESVDTPPMQINLDRIFDFVVKG